MIPFRDNVPSHTIPVVTVSLIVLNLIAFVYELSLGPDLLEWIDRFGVVPARVLNVSPASSGSVLLSFFTSLFLHGGWMHLIGNMWYLWIFGDNIEDRLGHLKYLLFYILSGLGASIVHIIFNPHSSLPSIGASGAIAGVLGAYLVSYPFARVLTLIPLLLFIQFVEIPAVFVLGLWFLFQLFSGTTAITSGVANNIEEGGVAWWAHIGGFLLGIVLLYALRPQPRQPVYRQYY